MEGFKGKLDRLEKKLDALRAEEDDPLWRRLRTHGPKSLTLSELTEFRYRHTPDWIREMSKKELIDLLLENGMPVDELARLIADE